MVVDTSITEVLNNGKKTKVLTNLFQCLLYEEWQQSLNLTDIFDTA